MDTKTIMDSSGSNSPGLTIDATRTEDIKTQISDLKPQYLQTLWAGASLLAVSLLVSLGLIFWCEDDCRDWPYLVLGLSAIATLTGLVLIAQSGSVNKRLGRWESDLRFLSDLGMALQMSEQLPMYVQKEPETIIKENQGTSTAKETKKAPDYVFPKQQMKRQIIEAILSRHTN